jgi:2-amino-4-hydroxy-6-hydroxymethyldihydropteridine diphosphokinase
VRAAIALGSNLPSEFGGPEETLREAVRRLKALGEVVAVSSFYVTEPVEYVDQPMFVNGAVVIETELRPVELLRGLLGIEAAMGRVRVVAKGPRVVDRDLILYGDVEMATEELTLPHPAMRERRFVLEPLAEVAAGWVVEGKTVGELLAAVVEEA